MQPLKKLHLTTLLNAASKKKFFFCGPQSLTFNPFGLQPKIRAVRWTSLATPSPLASPAFLCKAKLCPVMVPHIPSKTVDQTLPP